MKHLLYTSIIILLFSSCSKSTGDDPQIEPSFTMLDCTVTNATQQGKNDGTATFKATIEPPVNGYVISTGFEYRKSGEQFTILSCGASLTPTVTAVGLEEGTYEYLVYATTANNEIHTSASKEFTIKSSSSPSPTEPTFTMLDCTVTDVTEQGKNDGTATFKATINSPTDCNVTNTGFKYRKPGEQYTVLSCGTSLTPSANAVGLAEGTYEYLVYATTADNKTYTSSSKEFTVRTSSSPSPTEPTFTMLDCTVKDVTEQGKNDGTATFKATINSPTDGYVTNTGFKYRKPGEQYTVLSCGASLTPTANAVGLSEGTYEYLVFASTTDNKTFTSSSKEFTIRTSSSPTQNDITWAELPSIDDANKDRIIDSDKTLYLAYHLCGGSEKNAQRNGKARNYTVCFSSEHHCPVWVAAPRHKMYEGSANRTDAYGKDPDIPSSIQYSSKSTGAGCNKGHMLGSKERTSSTETNRQVFYYTNIAPQNSTTFNTGGGAWNNLEDYVDTQVCADTLYIVVGCYFKTHTDRYGHTSSPSKISFGGRNDVSRPTMFYYAMLRTKKGNTGKSVKECSSSELQCVAMIMNHSMEKGHKPHQKDMISIEELEHLTGFTYFTNVSNAPKSTYTASDWDL